MRKQSVLCTETELRNKLDELYELSKSGKIKGFEGLLEIASSEPTIVSAVHRIKSNSGAETKGIDNKTIRTYLQKPVNLVILEVQNALRWYNPQMVKRKQIPKKNGKTRPLGIPAAIDKIVQECIRITIEPILEAKMFNHSYGFRPMRSQQHAIARITSVLFKTGYTWVVEGDITGFFDNVHHSILLKKLYQMGIHDRRILAIIKKMLEAGILGECNQNLLGTPQGGIISPLLANVYLNGFDWSIAKAWEYKKTEFPYKNKGDRTSALKKGNLCPAYLIRYADDWVILTNTRKSAETWKQNAARYLKEHLNLELSREKTKITQISRKAITFLGMEIKQKKRKKIKTVKHSYITVSKPDMRNLDSKMKEAIQLVKEIRHAKFRGNAIDKINRANSIVRGLINYYQITTQINTAMNRYAKHYLMLAFKSMKSNKCLNPQWIPANAVQNHKTVHQNYTSKIPAIKVGEQWIGITSPKFAKFTAPCLKNQLETPYTDLGRNLHRKRTKKAISIRADELLSLSYSEYIVKGLTDKIYNFEFYINRAYAFNRDKGRCKCCGRVLMANKVRTHHIRKNLSLKYVNRTPNLETICDECHRLVHSKTAPETIERRRKLKILKLQEKLML